MRVNGPCALPRGALFSTERLRLRPLDERDAGFLVELLNDPQFIALIGDREVRTHDHALAFLEYSIRDSYRSHGFGPYLIECYGEQPEGASAGLCGLYRRDYLTCPDLGYALLPAFRGKGIAREAAEATLRFGRDAFGLHAVVGITAPGNHASARVLEHCAMHCAGHLRTRVGELVSEFFIPSDAAQPASAFFRADRATLVAPPAPAASHPATQGEHR
ncbi:MAG: GNAT family N-acetyltransferase [Pseudomonadota bacterium]